MAAALKMRLTEDVKRAIAGHIDAAKRDRRVLEMVCPICDNPAFECPVKTTPCGHLHHRDCLSDWLKGKAAGARTCPLCQTLLTGEAYQASDLTVKRVLDLTEVLCPLKCGPPAKRVRVCYEELKKHIEQCPKTPVVCGNEGCDEVRDRAVMEATHVAVCYHALVTCEKCGSQTIKRGELQKHKTEQCTQRPYKCGHCGTDGLVHSEREEHEAQCTGPAKISDLAQLKRENKELRRERERRDDKERADKERLRAQLCKIITDVDKEQQLPQLVLSTLAYTEGIPLRLVVKCAEEPWLAGTYELLPQRFNGAPVYGHSSGYRVYRTCSSSWMVAMSDKTMKQNRGSLHSVNKNSPVLAEGSWVHINDKGEWQAAPGTSIVAEPTD
eukprot:TRINITY_DN2723_c0_g1_i6.p2 TRINITY_DN2723_c0_g1~~TRINITY_DN2723_c0_g1_i6.p2  ORF type:complete len:412 (+),score=122.16 TRINITY_DN2723_c0_g1_i6:87-1238(+)